MQWAYGITTIPSRRYKYLERTIQSLKEAGFDNPTLFVDACPSDIYKELDLPTVFRSHQIRAYGNWLLTLMELWIRFPEASRYAIFQDDIVAYKNLKTYLDTCELTDGYYWNLYTFPQNEDLRKPGVDGWYPSNQRGRGALGLVFTNNTVFRLLTSENMQAKPRATKNPHRSIDGVIVTAMNRVNILEYVHYPTLLQHTGTTSSIGNPQHDRPFSFKGEEFDATQFIPEKEPING